MMRESETVENKSSLSELKEGIVSMVAMLNKNGHGTVYFGVYDDGKVVGVDIGKDTLKNLTSTVFDSTDPHVIPTVNILEEDGKRFIRVTVDGNNRPYFYKNVVYVRTGEEDRKAPADEIRRMFRSSEDLLVQTVSGMQSLGFTGLEKILRSRGMHIASGRSLEEACGLRNVQGGYNLQAQLLSDQNNASVIVTVFRGRDRTSFSRRDEFSGRCFLQIVEDVNGYVQNMNETIPSIDSHGRRDEQLFDPMVFKEAWVNACVHNSWMTGNPPYVQIFDDRLEVVSFGGIPYWMSMDDFYSGISQPVNESLMNVFLMAGIVEHTGHGIPEIVGRYGRDSIEVSEGMVRVTIPFMAERAVARLREVNEGDSVMLTKTDRRILGLMFDNPGITLDELSSALDMKRPTVAKHCADLQKRGLLKRYGSRKTGEWMVCVDLDGHSTGPKVDGSL